MLEINEILNHVDHTLLLQGTTEGEIKQILDDGIRYHVASACIPPCYVAFAKAYTKGNLPICTVIGFPNGYSVTAVKLWETKQALADGADEIDMVINIAMLKNRQYQLIEDEIRQIKAVCGDRILKVIIETCLLTEAEKIEMCKIVTSAGADYIKTSTGFSTTGATFDDIKLFKANVGANVKIKAAGGISSIDDAIRFIELGADRLGTSRIVKIVKNEDAQGY